MSAETLARAARIRLMIFDVDGVLTDGGLHGPRSTRIIRRGDVPRIAGCPIAGHLAQNGRITAQGVSFFFQQEHGSPLGHDKPVPPAVKGTAGLLRRIVARGQGLHAGKARKQKRLYARIAATRQHNVRMAMGNAQKSLANGVVGRGAGGHGRKVCPLEACFDGNNA